MSRPASGMREFVVLGISRTVKKPNKGKNTAIEGQDLEENVFRAFVDIFCILAL